MVEWSGECPTPRHSAGTLKRSIAVSMGTTLGMTRCRYGVGEALGDALALGVPFVKVLGSALADPLGAALGEPLGDALGDVLADGSSSP